MRSEIVPIPPRELARTGLENPPAAFDRADDRAARRFIEFFKATIRNKNTHGAYAQVVAQFFAWWEHLAAIRMLFDFLVTGFR